MNTEIKTPAIEKQIEFAGKKFTIKYPTNGEMIDFSIYSAKVSGNVDLISNISYSFGETPYFTIEAIAFAETILKDKFKEMLNVDSMMDLRPHETIGFVNLFKKEILPWFIEWRNFLNKDMSEMV